MFKAPAFLKPLRGKLRKYRLHVWLLEGKEKHSSCDLTILYAGHLLNKNYIAHLAYDDGHRETHLGKAWTWNVSGIARNHPAVTLIVTETEEVYFNRFGGRKDYYIPCWVEGEIEFSRYNELAKHSENIKSDLRKIRKQNYQYEITKDKDKFDLFYHAMYRPYITKAHGNRAALMGYEAMMRQADITDLLLIKQGNEYIAGENLLYETRGVRAWSLGVKDEDQNHVKAGVIGALYYYKINYLISRGFDRYNAGASRAFLRDGVLQYKRKWGLRLTQARPGGFWIRAREKSNGAGAFFKNNPFIHLRNHVLHGLVFKENGAVQGIKSDDAKNISAAASASFDIPGLHELRIVPLSEHG